MTAPITPDRLTDAQEHRLGLAVTDALDAGNEHLPYRITLRLEQARQAALSAASPQGSLALQPATGAALGRGHSAVLHAGGGYGSPTGFEHRLWWRVGSVILPFLIVIAGLVGIGLWHDADDLVDQAEVDASLLLGDDDLPVSAMADRGFSVFLRNTRQ
ncbi:MAG: DUF3619 family protein [Burkholderiaceae bacterium]